MMNNSFFNAHLDEAYICQRLKELEKAKVGFYSIGLYPASLAYNCAMQTDGSRLLLAPREGRDLLGAFSIDALKGLDPLHVQTMRDMASHFEGERLVVNTLSDLILRCELVILSANSNHIEHDLNTACLLRSKLNRDNVVLGCLAGSFSNDKNIDESYVLCEVEQKLGFFSGFHRHGALLNPLDSFTANFCHPDALTALLASRILDNLSPNIQVSAGVHNIEGQYLKASKNISSIFAGFGYTYHKDNPGLLPTLLTLLLEQCLDQAASISMCRVDREKLYSDQLFPLTELGYGVQRIEASLLIDGDLTNVRDHTFAQLTAMVADIRGSMMMPSKGKPTRNFQAGSVLAENMRDLKRCPKNLEEMLVWCESSGLSKGGLEGLKSLKYLPKIIKKYSIPLHDASMVNLLYLCLYGSLETKEIVFRVMTQSRELTNYCQESVRPTHSRRIAEALNNIDKPEALELISKTLMNSHDKADILHRDSNIHFDSKNNPDYIKVMDIIESDDFLNNCCSY